MQKSAAAGAGFPPKGIFAGAAVACTLFLAGCSGPLSALEPEGPSARGAATLWWVMFYGSAAIFVAVSAVLAMALFRPAPLRRLGPEGMIRWGGIFFPLSNLVLLVIAAFVLGERLLATPRDPAPLRIEAVARQWQWKFRYPDGETSFDRLHMPAGRDVDFAVTSEDVIHSFWIPRLGGKIDAIPGHENVVRLRADRPGTFGGVCAEFCGPGHTVMTFTVEAHEEEDFVASVGELGNGEGGQ